MPFRAQVTKGSEDTTGDGPGYLRLPNGRWVIHAPIRTRRPISGGSAEMGLCPFCAGHEAMTPPEIQAIRTGSEPNQPGWTVRVIPNLYPIVRPEAVSAYGHHEVIIERPDHQAGIGDLADDALARLMGVYRDRLRALSDDPKIEWVQIFRNSGRLAGASQEHAHAQVVALSVLPPMIAESARRPSGHDQSVRDGSLVIEERPTMMAFCPLVSEFPLECWIGPRRESPDFRLAEDDELFDLGALLGSMLRRLARLIEPMAYNLVLHTSPPRPETTALDRWHVKIYPRVEGFGGLELGTGVLINPFSPSRSARHYRDV